MQAPSGKKNAGKPSGGASPFRPARSHQSNVPSSVCAHDAAAGVDVANEAAGDAEPRVRARTRSASTSTAPGSG